MKKLFVGLLMVFAAVPAYAESTSLAELMASGQPVECSFSKPDGSQSGTIYTAQSKMRGEFLVNEGGSTYPMHMISDGQTMHMWGGTMGEKQGMVIAVNPSGAPSPMGPQVANMNEEMDFSCKPWPVDSAKFTPPSDVQFQDMAKMMSEAYAGMAEVRQ